MADEQHQVELDDEAKALKLAQAKAEARQAIAKANADMAKAGLYEPQSKPVTGDTKVESTSPSLLNVVALRGLRSAVQQIAGDVHQALGDGACVLLVASRDFAASDAPSVEINGRLQKFADRFTEAEKALASPAQQGEQAPTEGFLPLVPAAIAAGQAGTAAMSLVGLTADLVGMFKTNYSITGRDVAFGFDALAAVAAHELMQKKIDVFLDGFRSLEGSSTINSFTEMVDRRRGFENLLLLTEATELTTTESQINALGKQIDAAKELADVDALQKERAALQTPKFLRRTAEIAACKALVAAFDQYATGITDVPEGASYSLLVAAALRDVLHEGVKGKDNEWRATHILYLAVTAGGDEVTRSGLFQHNEYLGLIGACEVTYALVGKSGVIRAADSLGRYTAAQMDLKRGSVSWKDF